MFDIRSFRVGTLPAPRWEVLFGENDTTLVPLDFSVWLLCSAEHIGIIDTGLPLDPADRAALDRANQGVHPEAIFQEPRTLADAYAAFGITPEEVDFALVTQTVTYSTGGLNRDLLPRAEVYIARAGVLEFLDGAPGHPAPEFYFTTDAWSALRTFGIEGRLHLVDERTEVVPGVVFEATGGHHPGSAGVIVQTEIGSVGILETAFTQENLDQRRPIGIAEDVATCRRVIERYLAECDLVIPIHEPGLSGTMQNVVHTLSGGSP